MKWLATRLGWLALASLPAPLCAQCLEQTLSLPGSNRLGLEAAFDDDVMLLTEAAPSSAELATVHVFERDANGWAYFGALPTPPAADLLWYGTALAVEGDLALVGNVSTSSDGLAFVFERQGSGWVLSATLQGSYSTFGRSVAIDQGQLFVSGYFTHVFELQGGVWTETAVVGIPMATGPTSYGTSISADGDVVVVGARTQHNANGSFAGNAYVHRRVGGVWSDAVELPPSSPGAGQYYGTDVAVSGPRLAVSTGGSTGRVHLFELQGNGSWLEVAVVAEDADEFYQFGNSLDMDGDRLVVGASLGYGAVPEGGVALLYRFDSTEWSRESRFFPPIAGGGSPRFGWRVGLEGDDVFGTSPLWNRDEGACWTFDASTGGALATTCASTPNSTGVAAGIDSRGNPSLAYDDFRLTAHDVPAGTFGLFFYGRNGNQLPFGDGFLCVSGGVYRLGPPQASTPSGTLERQLDFDAPPASSGSGQITVGSTWHAQLWFRDLAAGGAGFNLTNALRVTFCP